MIPSRCRAAVMVAAVVAGPVAVSAGTSAHATSTVVRYASPTGVASAHCLKSAPCDLVTAINDAPYSAEVVIESGTYYKASPLGTVLEEGPSSNDLNVHGPSSGPRPVIYSQASPSFYFSGSNLSDIDLVSTSAGTGVLDYNGTVSRVDVTGSGESACASYHLLVDSLCIATGPAGSGIDLENSTGGPAHSTYTVTLRGDTAVGTGAEGVGLRVRTSGPATTNATAVNDIFSGVEDDVVASTTGPSNVLITLHHSDYHAILDNPPDGEVITGDDTDIATPPKFVDAAAGNYQEKAGSPTINAGAKDPAGDTDLNGIPRTSGGAPDMGAYEVAKKPAVGKLAVAKRGATSAVLNLRVNPQGLPTKVTLTATHGRHHLRKTFMVGAGAKAVTRHLKLHGLKRRTTYHVTGVAVSVAGTTKIAAHKVRTN